MIVIHPNDKTTSFLKAIYKKEKDVILIDETWTNRKIRETIGTSNSRELVVMLGHGSCNGLFAPYGDEQFARNIVDSRLVYLLREHPCVGIWCNANQFAEKYKLRGLFTGMIISEPEEAWDWGVDIENDDLARNNEELANDFEYCLRKYSLNLIPQKMKDIQDYSSPLKDFNYNNIFYYG